MWGCLCHWLEMVQLLHGGIAGEGYEISELLLMYLCSRIFCQSFLCSHIFCQSF